MACACSLLSSWLVECAKQNKRLDERSFSVDLPQIQDTTPAQKRVMAQQANVDVDQGTSTSGENQLGANVSKDSASTGRFVCMEVEEDNGRQPDSNLHDKMDISHEVIYPKHPPADIESQKENYSGVDQRNADTHPRRSSVHAESGQIKGPASGEGRLHHRAESSCSTNQRTESSFNTTPSTIKCTSSNRPNHVNNRVRVSI